MLHTNSKIATTKQAFVWFFEIKDHPKIKLESVQLMQRGILKDVDVAKVEFDKFYWNYADRTTQIIMNCTVKRKPVKLVLLLDNLQNRLYIEAENAEIEEYVLKYVF